MSGESVAQDQIAAFVDRILRLKEEAKAINQDIREIYAEAKGQGFDKTVLGKLVNYVEKRAEKPNELAEGEAIFDLYLTAYDTAKGRVGTKIARAHTHETEPQPSPMAGTAAASTPLGAAAETNPEAKASTGNGATVQGEDSPADSVTGDASRPAIGRSMAATSDDGRDSPERRAPHSPETAERGAGPETAPASDDGVAPPVASSSAVIPIHQGETSEQRIKRLRPHCQNPTACAGAGPDHCHGCRRSITSMDGGSAA